MHRVRAASIAASTMVISYRQDCAKRKLSVLNLVTGQKSGFCPTGVTRCTDSVKLGSADGHLGPLGCAKFHVNWRMGWESDPQNIKNFHFLVKDRLSRQTP